MVIEEKAGKPYNFPLSRFVSKTRFEKIKKFSENVQTPFLLVDLNIIKKNYQSLTKNMPLAKVYYAVKSNPMEEVILLLRDLGSNFDVATVYELDQLLKLGISPDRISFGNTIKKSRDIAYFYNNGVRLFATDSEEDVRKIGVNAPGSKVFFRILTEGTGADWPLSRKFGTHPDAILGHISLAQEMGLEPYGLSFHVGSQQRDIGEWDAAIAHCTYIFNAAAEIGIKLKMINLGGGFPAKYIQPTPKLEIYTKEIMRFLSEDFGDDIPEIIVEPGRSLVADSGVIVSEVITTAYKSKYSPSKWVYTDIGMFGGLIETMDESIKFPIYSEKEGDAIDVILAGPTCDSMDILYEDYKYQLPDTLTEGDKLYFITTGAYTQSYSSVGFNGFPPLKAFVLK
ncbi:type III PLP-dependent enzyme [Spirochaeta isovalerica]|uniref:ornithine decarboxylase n=1 Tax=Spirochaeta isovalerica TaxID=150 RepID=A0A841R939_9SPIO|nr:type III PLP-dependent enzyme [Spirochaeta isovalerica]MBB6479697.1 ornithine decarboxylase [Spirochaeta isovalerica]